LAKDNAKDNDNHDYDLERKILKDFQSDPSKFNYFKRKEKKLKKELKERHKIKIIKSVGKNEIEISQEIQRCKICKGKATRWYKVMSTIIYRCEKHKNNIDSPVYDQGKISSRGELIGYEDIVTEQGTNLVSFYREKSGKNFPSKELEQENEKCIECRTGKNNFMGNLKEGESIKKFLEEFVEHLKLRHPKNHSVITYNDDKGEHNLWLEHPEEFINTIHTKAKIKEKYGRPIPKNLVGTDVSAREFREIPPEHVEKISREIMDIKENSKNDYEKYAKIEKVLMRESKERKEEQKSPEQKLYDFLVENVYKKYPPPEDDDMHEFIQDVYRKEPELKAPLEKLMSKVTDFDKLDQIINNSPDITANPEHKISLIDSEDVPIDDFPKELGHVMSNCTKCKEYLNSSEDDESIKRFHEQKKMKKHFKDAHPKLYPLYKKHHRLARTSFIKQVNTNLETQDEENRLRKAYNESKKPNGDVDYKKFHDYIKKRKKELEGHVPDEHGKCKVCGTNHDVFLSTMREQEIISNIAGEIANKIPENLLQYDWEDVKLREEKLDPTLAKLTMKAIEDHNITDKLQKETIVECAGLEFAYKRAKWLEQEKEIKKQAKIFLTDHDPIVRNALGGKPNDPNKNPKRKRDDFPPYEEAREYALDQDCRSMQDWINHTKTDQFDTRFPLHPHTAYKPIFKEKGGYPFFLGYTRKKHRPRLTQEEVKKIITKFDARWVTDYQMYPDAMLMTWFENQGLFKVKDPLQQILFKNLVSWRTDPEGIKAIRFYFHAIIVGDLSRLKQTFYNPETDRVFSLETKEGYIDRQFTRLSDVRPQQLLQHPEQVGVAKIMDHALSVVPDENDRDWWNFQVSFSVKLLWYAIFDENTGKTELAKIRREKRGQNKFHDTVLKTFFEEYKSVTTMSYKQKYYTYHLPPFLNQLYCAWMMRKRNFFFDMSSTGTGKTGSGLVSAMSQQTKRCLIICPKNIVVQWHKNVKKFYNSCYASHSEQHKTFIPNEFFSDDPDNKTKFHVINYDKFNNVTSANTVVKQFISRNSVDMIILDESHRVKSAKEDEKEDTATRRNVSLLINELRKDSRNLKVLMLSATPVVNKISEGKSLLEMGTGTDYTFSTYPTVLNASKLYTEFQPYCMRWVKQYPIDQRGKDDPIIVRAYIPEHITQDQFGDLHWDDFDEFNTKYRIATILKLIREAKKKKDDARIIIYTDYIDGIVDQLQIALNNAELRYGLFIGADKSGMIRKTGKKDKDGNEIIENPFVLGELDVLIASSPIAVGVDDLQYDCNTIIFNGLVWTWAKFEQIVGRLVRTGQTQDHVNIHLVFANLNGYEYDYKVKYLRILAKKSIGDCVTTGTLPPKISLGSTEKQRHGMITKMWENKQSGFPEKEQIDKELLLEAQHELEEEIEKENEFIDTIQPVEEKKEKKEEEEEYDE